MTRRVVVEADGASRGNPGPAAYGALLRDAETGAVIAEDGRTLGVATNNVAEYSGLVAGLELARDHAPGALVEVRMDSKLVVEQMSGRWKIKNADLTVLADRARAVATPGTSYTWIPRERNGAADRLANDALDGRRSGVTAAVPEAAEPAAKPARGWAGAGPEPTTLIVVRHGVTPMTVTKAFSGGLGGSNPGLTDEGRTQARAAGAWLAPLADRIDAVVASPVRRTVETAEIVGDLVGRAPMLEPGFAEMEFGAWDGLTFSEVAERHPDDLNAWLGSMDHAPGGGESFRQVEKRVVAGLERVIADHAGKTVVVVSHVTPIKIMVGRALGAPLDSVYRMELSPASVTVISHFLGGRSGDEPMASLRLYNALPGDTPVRL